MSNEQVFFLIQSTMLTVCSSITAISERYIDTIIFMPWDLSNQDGNLCVRDTIKQHLLSYFLHYKETSKFLRVPTRP